MLEVGCWRFKCATPNPRLRVSIRFIRNALGGHHSAGVFWQVIVIMDPYNRVCIADHIKIENKALRGEFGLKIHFAPKESYPLPDPVSTFG